MGSSNLSGRRVFLSSLIVLFLMVGLGVGVYLVQRRQETVFRAAGDVVLTMTAPSSVNTGQSFTVPVTIGPGSVNHVSAVDLQITYPSSILRLDQITPGPFFINNYPHPSSQPTINTEMLSLGISCSQNTDCRPDIEPVKSAISCQSGICVNTNTNIPVITPGVARIILGAPCMKTDDSPPPPTPWVCYPRVPSTAIELVSLRFTALAPGSATIAFDVANTLAAATEYAQPTGTPVNVVNTSQLNSVTVSVSGPTPTPTPGGPTNTPTPTPTRTPTPTPTNTPTPTPTRTPTPTPTNTPTPTPTLKPTATPTSSPTPAPQTGSLTFSVKFEGITGEVSNTTITPTVSLIFRRGNNDEIVLNNVALSHSGSGVYTTTVTNIAPAVYDSVLVKGWVHLRKNFGSVTINANEVTTKNWTSYELQSADITGWGTPIPDNKVDSADVAVFFGSFDPFAPAPAGNVVDLDLNGRIDGGDYSLVVGNYNPFGGGDQ